MCTEDEKKSEVAKEVDRIEKAAEDASSGKNTCEISKDDCVSD